MRQFTENLHESIFFTCKRQKDSGGFGATPRLPATVEDTYHALRIVDAVERYCGLPSNISIHKDRHKKFLLGLVESKSNLEMKGRYQLIWCLNWCGVQDITTELTHALVTDELPGKSPEVFFYFLRAVRILGLDVKSLFQVEQIVPLVSFEGIMFRRWVAIFINEATGSKVLDNAFAARWILACQNYDGGFGFLPGSTSYIENTYYALKALSVLGYPVRVPIDVAKYLIGCQTGSGGFSRKAGAAPFLDSTWYGTSALIYLQAALEEFPQGRYS